MFTSMVLLLGCIFFLSGCNKLIDWGKNNFKQATPHSKDIVQLVAPYVKSTIAYQQFSTLANFDVMFLTDYVRLLYVDYYKRSRGLSREQESLMRQRMLNENQYYISFYVAAAQPENHYESNKSLFSGEYQKLPEILGEKDASWSVKLRVGGKDHPADIVKVVDLPTEYKHFFGNAYSQFKKIYLVRFNARTDSGNCILSPNTKHNISLIFTSSIHETDVQWKHCLYSKQ